MPVTTRLQARRALEAALKPLSPSQHSEQSPAPSRSPPHLGPIKRSFATVHARRQLCHILHHFQGDITRSSPQFPHPSPIYVPEPYLALSPQDTDLPDYVWHDDYDYGFDSPCQTCVSTSPAKQPSSQSPFFISAPKDIGDELRGTKRQRSDDSSPLHAQSFLGGLPFGTSPALRKYITPVSRSTSSVSSKAPTIEEPEQPVRTAEEVNSLRRQQTMQHLRDTYLALHSHHSSSSTLSPILELPEMETKFYEQHMPGPIEPTPPNWLGARDIRPTWQGSLSPKVSPMGTCYAVEEVGKRRKLQQIRADMRIERLLNPEPKLVNDAVVQENRPPSFQEVVQMAEIQRFDELQERHGRDAVVRYSRPERLGGWSRMSLATKTEGFDPRWRDGVNRAQQRDVFTQERMEGRAPRGYARYMAFRERYGEGEVFVERRTWAD